MENNINMIELYIDLLNETTEEISFALDNNLKVQLLKLKFEILNKINEQE